MVTALVEPKIKMWSAMQRRERCEIKELAAVERCCSDAGGSYDRACSVHPGPSTTSGVDPP